MEIAVFVEVVEAIDNAVNVKEDCYLVCGVVIHYYSYCSATCCVAGCYVLWFSHREERGYRSRKKGKPATTNKKGVNMVPLPP
jgi:hypothetical protein